MRPLSACDLAGRLALNKQARSWRGDCPACGYARAFSLRPARDGAPLVYCANGCDQAQLADEITRRLGQDWTPQPKRDDQTEKQTSERKARRAAALFSGAAHILANDPAGRYLARRHLPHLRTSAALRFRGDCYHPEGGRYSALVALVQNAAGQGVAAHRSYLTSDGHKAAAEPPKASLGPVWGGAIRIDPVAPELVIGEGIETAASAGMLLGLPAWAAIFAGNMEKGLQLPPEVRSVVIAADRDAAGTRAAMGAASRWRAEGRRVRIAWPDEMGADFNDILCRRMEAHRDAA